MQEDFRSKALRFSAKNTARNWIDAGNQKGMIPHNRGDTYFTDCLLEEINL